MPSPFSPPTRARKNRDTCGVPPPTSTLGFELLLPLLATVLACRWAQPVSLPRPTLLPAPRRARLPPESRRPWPRGPAIRSPHRTTDIHIRTHCGTTLEASHLGRSLESRCDPRPRWRLLPGESL